MRDDAADVNEKHWDRVVADGCGFTVPWLDLDRDLVRRYASGELEVVPETLIGMYPACALSDVEGKDVLCLANGGGQQSAVFGLLGARVVVVDISEGQLAGDRIAAEHYGYDVTTIHTDMRDLSRIGDGSFDLIYQAPSTSYIPDLRAMYSEVARVLRAGGTYAVQFTNPATEFTHEEWDGVGYRIIRPYAERVRRTENGAIEFRHYLSDIFNGLIEAGLSIYRVEEDPLHLIPKPDARPGGWEHCQMYLPGFAVVARKRTE